MEGILSNDRIIQEFKNMRKEMNELKQRIEIIEEENNVLRKENEYLGLLITTQMNEQTINYTKRLWGDNTSYDINQEEGTYVQILQTILEESNNDAIDMYVICQLKNALLETRMNTCITLNTLEIVGRLLKRCEDEDYSLVLKCLKAIIISNPNLIGFCVDYLCDNFEKNLIIDKMTLLEAFYSCVLNNQTEVVHSKIIHSILPLFKDIENGIFPNEYVDLYFTIIKHSYSTFDSLKELIKNIISSSTNELVNFLN
ncbi:hypothetical protein ENUP19_0003G0008 [Entamoeba nuttalli]|uniref:Uncharacterized protein n=2 Tax=Entamoeba nuttalli TaxID=412467 RepID=K2GRG3_ENTNP|nr:hypothetical protein ENU1_193340 [Entamoeba nuttalli P19]EKE37548.1 hypothetical protein ENU1_193340 [Entamoeba nuttalli P19]|eukprot:XP_008860118.1 hypothetical protein ENU1_193340 [Entamoeba nuttalli P19]